MKRKLVIVGGFLAVVALAVGVYLFYPAFHPTEDNQAQAASQPNTQTHGSGIVCTIKERILNLSDKGTRRYVKLGVAIEVAAPAGWDRLPLEEQSKRTTEVQQEVDRFAPILNDAMTTLVTGRTAEQLSDLAGKDALREDLRARFGTLLEKQKVTHVYFTEFLIQ